MKKNWTPWYREIVKTRRASTTTPDGLESKRSWANRLGIDVNAVIGWERGALPRLATVKQIVERLDMPTSEYYRMVALLDDSPPPAPAVPIPVYEGSVAAGQYGRVIGDPESTTTLGADILGQTGATTHIVALRLDKNADSMEPVIPRGAMVFVDTMRGKEWHSFKEGSVYAVVSEPDRQAIDINYPQRRGDDIWFVSANPNYPPKRSWTNDLSRLVIGWVFHFQGQPRRLHEGSERENARPAKRRVSRKR